MHTFLFSPGVLYVILVEPADIDLCLSTCSLFFFWEKTRPLQYLGTHAFLPPNKNLKVAEDFYSEELLEHDS